MLVDPIDHPNVSLAVTVFVLLAGGLTVAYAVGDDSCPRLARAIGRITMLTATFWKAAAERAVKTAAQALLSLWLVGDVLNVLTIDWGASFGVAGGAALLSFLFSIVSSGVGDSGTPSLVSAAPADEIGPGLGPDRPL